jgi:hypothetical protein
MPIIDQDLDTGENPLLLLQCHTLLLGSEAMTSENVFRFIEFQFKSPSYHRHNVTRLTENTRVMDYFTQLVGAEGGAGASPPLPLPPLPLPLPAPRPLPLPGSFKLVGGGTLA